MHSPKTYMDFGQKLIYVILLIILSGAMVAIFEFSSRLICSNRVYPFETALKLTNTVTVNGKLIDIGKLTDTAKISTAKPFEHLDMSNSFPTFTILGRLQGQNNFADPDIQKCVGNRGPAADTWVQRRLADTGFRLNNQQLVNCPLPNGAQGACFFTKEDKDELLGAIYGDISFSDSNLADKKDIRKSLALVSIRGKVYDVGKYLNIASDGSATRAETAFFGEPFTTLLIKNVGKDMTSAFEGLQGKEDVLKCMDKLFYAGVTATQGLAMGCTLIQPVYFALVALMILILLPKYLTAFGISFSFGKIMMSDAYLIISIHCSAEDPKTLAKTIDSAVLSNYRDSQKLLFITCDGDLQHAVAGATTHELVLDVLQYNGGNPAVRDYSAMGEGSRASNSCLVYSGHYIKDGHRVPYVVLYKKGSYGDNEDRGDRGKRDTNVILLGFLNKIIGTTSYLSSLEYELYTRIKQLKFDPRRFEYALMLEAGMEVDMSAVSLLVNRLDSDETLAMVYAKTNTSFAPLQSYNNYLRNHLSAMYRNIFGSLVSSSQNCIMIRLKYSDGSPCFLNSDVIKNYANNFETPKSLQERTLAYQAEDMHLGVSLLKQEPKLRIRYEMGAKFTRKPVPFFRLLSNEKMYHNAYFATIKESTKLTIRYKISGYLTLLAMILLPAFTIYNYYLLARFILEPFMYSYLIPPAVFVGLHLIAFLGNFLQFQFQMAFSCLIYLLVGIPFYCILVPLYSFFNLNSYSVVPTAPQMHESRRHGGMGEGVAMQVEKYTISQWKSLESDPASRSPKSSPDRSPDFRKKSEQRKSILREPSSLAPAVIERSNNNNKMSMYSKKVSFLERDDVPDFEHFKRPSEIAPEDIHPTHINDTIKKSDITDLKKSQLEYFMQRPDSIMSHDTIRAPIQSLRQTKQIPPLPTPIPRKLQEEAGMDDKPLRAMSIARSDYESMAGDNRTTITNYNRDTRITDMMSEPDVDLYEQTGISREDVRDEIKLILQDADLNSVTRRQVKNELVAVFGDDVEKYNDFINVCIEEYTLEKLALL